MSATNKLRNKLQKCRWQSEGIHRARDRKPQAGKPGVRDQVTSDVKDVGERVKDTFGGRWGRRRRRI